MGRFLLTVRCITAIACLAVPTALRAADPVLVGGMPLEGPNMGALILLQSENPATLQGRVINVFRKDGAANDFTSYDFRGQIRAQSDPRTINAILRRSTMLTSKDHSGRLLEIESLVDNLFQDLDLGTAGLDLGEKLSVLVAVSETEQTYRDNLVFATKRFPSIGTVAGMAFAEAVAGEVTYELRLCPEGLSGPDDGNEVIGRVTVDPSTTYLPIAPGQPQVLSVLDSRGDLNVRLRWEVPSALGRTGPLTFGYNIYRIPEAMGLAAWEAAAPTQAEVEAQLGLDPGSLDDSVYRINNTPVLPPKDYTAAEADSSALDALLQQRFGYPNNWATFSFADVGSLIEEDTAAPASRSRRIELDEAIEALQSDFAYIDDNNRWFDGSALTKGDGFYYAVAARNALGTGGELSLFKLIRIPDNTPTGAPENVRTENEFIFDSNDDSHTQKLAVKWDALRDENGDIRTDVYYFVYRWNAPTEMLDFVRRPFAANQVTTFEDEGAYFRGELPVPVGLVAGPGDLGAPDPEGTFRFVDTIVDNAYQGITFFYTVRAAVGNGTSNSALAPGAPIFSPHSSPTWGVLRDRVGPGPSNNRFLQIPCIEVSVICTDVPDTPKTKPEHSLDPDQILIEFTCLPDVDADQASLLSFAEFRYEQYSPSTGTTDVVYVGAAPFEGGWSATTVAKIPTPALQDFTVSCRVILANGKISDWVNCPISLVGKEAPVVVEAGFQADVTESGYTDSSNCGFYFPYDPSGDYVPPRVSFRPGEDTWSYHIYRRVDDGNDELLTTFELPQDSSDPLDTAVDIMHEDEDFPAYASRVCYYLQAFDQHGNPRRRELIGCMTVARGRLDLPVPTITKLEPTGTEANPRLQVSWFCPPAGVERFAILVSDAVTGAIVETFSGGAIAAPIDLIPQLNYDGDAYRRYATVRTDAFVEGGTAGEFEPAVVESALFTAVIENGIELGRAYRIRIQALGPTIELPAGRLNLPSYPSEALDGAWSTPVATTVGPNGPDVNWPARRINDADDIGNSIIGPKLIDTSSEMNWESFQGVGIRVGHIRLATSIQYQAALEGGKAPAVEYRIPTTLEISRIFYTLGDGTDRTALPGLIYRMEVEAGSGNASNNNRDQPVSGDLVQCGPVISEDTLAYNIDGGQTFLRDPFIFLEPDEDDVNPYVYPVYIIDNQPVLRGSTYRYFLATLTDRGSLENVWNLGTVDIPE